MNRRLLPALAVAAHRGRSARRPRCRDQPAGGRLGGQHHLRLLRLHLDAARQRHLLERSDQQPAGELRLRQAPEQPAQRPGSSLPGPIWDISVLNLGKGGEATNEALSRMDRGNWTCPCVARQPLSNQLAQVLGVQRHPPPARRDGADGGDQRLTRGNISAETRPPTSRQLVQKAEADGLDVVITTVHPPPQSRPGSSQPAAPPAQPAQHPGRQHGGPDLNSDLDRGRRRPAGRWGGKSSTTSGRRRPTAFCFSDDYQIWEHDALRPGQSGLHSIGDPVGHPDADGFDLMTWDYSHGDGQTYAETIEYSVKLRCRRGWRWALPRRRSRPGRRRPSPSPSTTWRRPAT